MNSIYARVPPYQSLNFNLSFHNIHHFTGILLSATSKKPCTKERYLQDLWQKRERDQVIICPADDIPSRSTMPCILSSGENYM